MFKHFLDLILMVRGVFLGCQDRSKLKKSYLGEFELKREVGIGQANVPNLKSNTLHYGHQARFWTLVTCLSFGFKA